MHCRCLLWLLLPALQLSQRFRMLLKSTSYPKSLFTQRLRRPPMSAALPQLSA